MDNVLKEIKPTIEEKISEEELDDEVIELEFDEESVSYYIVDENNNEIGVCLIEDGEEVEYLYEDEDKQAVYIAAEVAKQRSLMAAANIESVKQEMTDFKDQALDAAKELQNATNEIKEIMEDAKDSIRIFPKRKKK